MRKILICILFLFCLTGCKKKPALLIEDYYLKVYKVDILCNIAKEASYLNLMIVTTSDIPYLTIEKNTIIQDLKIEQHRNIKLKKGNCERDGIIHEVKLNFKQEPFTITQLTINYLDKSQTVEIGKYQNINLPNNENLSANVVEKPADNCYELYTSIHNNTNRNIYLEDVQEYKKATGWSLVKKAAPVSSACVYTSGIQTYDHLAVVVREGYSQVEGILKWEYLTNTSELVVYSSFYINTFPKINDVKKNGLML